MIRHAYEQASPRTCTASILGKRKPPHACGHVAARIMNTRINIKRRLSLVHDTEGDTRRKSKNKGRRPGITLPYIYLPLPPIWKGDTWGGTALHTYHATGFVIYVYMLITSRNPYHNRPNSCRVSPRPTILCNPKILVRPSPWWQATTTQCVCVVSPRSWFDGSGNMKPLAGYSRSLSVLTR